MARIIVGIFKTESISVYYSPARFPKRANGKLFHAYNNKRNALSVAGLIKRRPVCRSTVKDKNNGNSSDLLNDDTSNIFRLQEHVSFLKTEAGPWTDILKSWKITHDIRKTMLKESKDVSEYMSTFLAFAQPNGFELVIQ